MVPGPPPLGPWDLPGAPRGGSRAQTTKVTFSLRPFGFASKFVSILMTIFGRFGVDLGSLLGVIFGLVGAFFGPSSSRNCLRTILSSKTYLFTKPFEINCFRCFFTQDGAKNDPRSLQDGSKIVLDRFLFVLNFRFDFLSFWSRIWCRFGVPNGAPGARLSWW